MTQYFMGGINAVGKSTLARTVKQLAPEFEIIHTGTAIMERLGVAPGDTEALRALPAAYKYRENVAMLSELTLRNLGRSVLYDSHYLNMIEGEVTPLISGMWPRLLGGLILVEAQPEIIYERIIQDSPAKERKLLPPHATSSESIHILGRYAQQTRDECERIGSIHDIPILTLRTDTQPLNEVAQQFIDSIRRSGDS